MSVAAYPTPTPAPMPASEVPSEKKHGLFCKFKHAVGLGHGHNDHGQPHSHSHSPDMSHRQLSHKSEHEHMYAGDPQKQASTGPSSSALAPSGDHQSAAASVAAGTAAAAAGASVATGTAAPTTTYPLQPEESVFVKKDPVPATVPTSTGTSLSHDPQIPKTEGDLFSATSSSSSSSSSPTLLSRGVGAGGARPGSAEAFFRERNATLAAQAQHHHTSSSLLSSSSTSLSSSSSSVMSGSSMVLCEEKLDVDKRSVSVGTLTVSKHVGSEMINVPVLLRREFVTIDSNHTIQPDLLKFIHTTSNHHPTHSHSDIHKHGRLHGDDLDTYPHQDLDRSMGTSHAHVVTQPALAGSEMLHNKHEHGHHHDASRHPAAMASGTAGSAIGSSRLDSSSSSDTHHLTESALLEDGGEVVLRMVVMAEKPVITTRLVAVEEIVVMRRRVSATQVIDEVLRREVADIHDSVPTGPAPVKWDGQHMPTATASEHKHHDNLPHAHAAGAHMSTSSSSSSSTIPMSASGGSVVAYEEQLVIDKERIPVGEVGVTKRIESERFKKSIVLTHDELQVVRRAMHIHSDNDRDFATHHDTKHARSPTLATHEGKGMSAHLGKSDEVLGRDDDTRLTKQRRLSSSQYEHGALPRTLAEAHEVITLMREEAAVNKRIVPVEEIVLRRHGVVHEQQHVHTELAREKIHVTTTGPVEVFPSASSSASTSHSVPSTSTSTSHLPLPVAPSSSSTSSHAPLPLPASSSSSSTSVPVALGEGSSLGSSSSSNPMRGNIVGAPDALNRERAAALASAAAAAHERRSSLSSLPQPQQQPPAIPPRPTEISHS